MIIGISGVATAGKDTLYNLLEKKLYAKNIKTKRIALADQLKKDLAPFIKEYIGVDILTASPEEKKTVRNLMVVYGKIKRNQTQGKHWTSIAQKEIDECLKNKVLPIITDIRYCEYKEDELFWLKNKNNGMLIHVTRVNEDGGVIPPANHEEKVNNPILKKSADFKLKWKTRPSLEEIQKDSEKILSKIERKIYANLQK